MPDGVAEAALRYIAWRGPGGRGRIRQPSGHAGGACSGQHEGEKPVPGGLGPLMPDEDQEQQCDDYHHPAGGQPAMIDKTKKTAKQAMARARMPS